VRSPYPFFLPKKALKRVFRGKFLSGLKRLYRRQQLRCGGPASLLADPKQFTHLLRRLHRHDWVVLVKPAMGDPSQVLRYLGRYTHRVAISNHRLLSFDGERVTFRWKDYAHGSKQKKMTLTATEFLRRFFLHVLPKVSCASATLASWPTAGGPECSRSHANCWAPNPGLPPSVSRRLRLCGAVPAAAPGW